jgi:hypothetical protein
MGFDHNIRKGDVSSGAAAFENPDSPVGVNRQVRKCSPTCVFHANSRGVGDKRAIRDAHVFAAIECKIVVARDNVAIGNMDIAAAEAVDAIVIWQKQAIRDVDSLNDSAAAVIQMERPLRRIPEGDAPNENIVGIREHDHCSGPACFFCLYRAVTQCQHGFLRVFPLSRVLGIKVLAEVRLLEIEENSGVSVDGPLPDDGDVLCMARNDDA